MKRIEVTANFANPGTAASLSRSGSGSAKFVTNYQLHSYEGTRFGSVSFPAMFTTGHQLSLPSNLSQCTGNRMMALATYIPLTSLLFHRFRPTSIIITPQRLSIVEPVHPASLTLMPPFPNERRICGLPSMTHGS